MDYAVAVSAAELLCDRFNGTASGRDAGVFSEDPGAATARVTVYVQNARDDSTLEQEYEELLADLAESWKLPDDTQLRPEPDVPTTLSAEFMIALPDDPGDVDESN